MLKLQTPVEIPKTGLALGFDDSIVMLGSCFSDSIGQRLCHAGFDVLVNPFGTIYNPLSVLESLRRLSTGDPFVESDCVRMGAGSDLVCSYSHHTSFARESSEEFLSNANRSLECAVRKFRDSSTVIITLGTAWCYFQGESDRAVSNCLKRPQAEFTRRRISLDEIVSSLESVVSLCQGKKLIFTVSPIRHMADGATGNLLSKSSLILSVGEIVSRHPQMCEYFPSYEIMMDELRDYRFYAEDMTHPSSQAEDYIFERFSEWIVSEEDRRIMASNLKAYKQSQHRKMH